MPPIELELVRVPGLVNAYHVMMVYMGSQIVLMKMVFHLIMEIMVYITIMVEMHIYPCMVVVMIQ